MMQQSNAIHTFLQEAEDLLSEIEAVALEALQQPSGDAVNQLFRAFHTIKGSGAMFGFDEVAAFTHRVETVLDRVRDRLLDLSPELVTLVLGARDEIKALLEVPPGTPAPLSESGRKIQAALESLSPGRTPSATAPCQPAPDASAPVAVRRRWRIHFVPPAGLMVSGIDPIALLGELRALGECTITASTEAIPPLEDFRPDDCYLQWRIDLLTERSADAIRDVFIFVEDGSDLSITPEPAVVARAGRPAAPPPPEDRVRPQGGGDAAVRKSAPPIAARPSTVRVPAEKLDRLVNLVGELVINQSRLAQAASRFHDHDLDVPVEEIERLVAELRDMVLGVRMTPIGATFDRFKRLVHDLSAELGKEIDLEIRGAETELDKSVLDLLGDPLVHLIRNSVDHGIEPVSERLAAGKPRRGRVRLSATHTGSSVVVRIEDDGRGLDLTTIRAKAVERHVISPDAVLSDKEIAQLIFLPGFSTARQVSSVSGRGVGMDVVKRQLEALRGTIALSTQAGQGTVTELCLPLTLAIIDGLMVAIGGERYIIPLSAVNENVELAPGQRATRNGRNLVVVREELVPYISLRDLFEDSSPPPAAETIVIVNCGDERVGLVVDRVIGNHQTVIQSLGRFYRGIDVVSGAAITGDGRVALILDVTKLVAWTGRHAAGPPNHLSPAAVAPENFRTDRSES